jgi:hypothetical protein
MLDSSQGLEDANSLMPRPSGLPDARRFHRAQGTGGVRAAQMRLRRTQPSESRELSAWIKARHYTKRCPPGYVLALEFQDGCYGNRIGGMLLGRAGSKSVDQDRILELTRMYFVDDTEPFVESRGLAMMRKYVRTWLPQIRLLLAYSDPSQGHEGKVYEADGWAMFGRTTHKKGYGWKSRPNRNDDPVCVKIRWVRTP